MVAESSLVDPVEQERCSGIVAGFGALEADRVAEALGGETDPTEQVRRTPDATPQSAVLATPLVVGLAGLRHPGSRTVFGPPHLHHALMVAIEGDAPVKAVTAHVEKAAALLQPTLESVEHSRRPVLGVGTGHDGAIATQELASLLIEILVGGDVVGDALALEPRGEPGIGREPPRNVLRFEIHDRPSPRREDDTGAVTVVVVVGEAELGMREQRCIVG